MKHNYSIKIVSYLFLIFSFTCAGYTSDLSEWKKTCIEKIQRDPIKKGSPLYERVIKTISCNDTDYIPKVPYAGECVMHDGLICQLMHNGIYILQGCYYEGPSLYWMTEIIKGLKGHHKPQEEKAFYEVLKYIPEGGKMLELGSYWAYYSLWFHKEIPNARNYLIDGNYENLCIGFRNFQLNGYVGDFSHGYLGAKNDPLIFENSGPLITVDNYLEEKGLDYIDLLSSDIQGAEYAMLLGAKEALKNHRVHYFFISTHSATVHQDCIDLLKQNDYHIVVEHDLEQSCSVDGLIVGRANSIKGIDYIKVSNPHFSQTPGKS